MILLPSQVYREFQLSIVIAKKMRMKMKTRVPRNLFGAPERKEGAQLLQETLDQERARFHKRWAVDPLAEDDDKENGPARASSKLLTPKKRCSPYTKQTSMHDYWRTRKMYEPSKKSPSNCSDAPRPMLVLQSPPQMQSLSLSPTPTQQPQQQQQQQQQQQTLSATEPLAESPTQSIAPEAQQPLDVPHTEKQFSDSVQPSTN